MKNIIKLFIVSIFAIFYSCSDIHDVHSEWMDRDEIIYLGKVPSYNIMPGKERVKLRWKMSSDPRVDFIRIKVTGDSEDIYDFPVNKDASPDNMLDSVMFDMAEGSYSFEFLNMSNDGEASLSRYSSKRIYGDYYISTLKPTVIDGNMYVKDGAAVIPFLYMENSVGINLLYTNVFGNDTTVFVGPQEKEGVAPDFVRGDAFSYETLYLPVSNAIDTFKVVRDGLVFPN